MSDTWVVSNPIITDKPLVSGFSTYRSIFHSSSSSSRPSKPRSSAFCEVGLRGEDAMVDHKMWRESIPELQILEYQQIPTPTPEPKLSHESSSTTTMTQPTRTQSWPLLNSTTISRALMVSVFAVALLWPSLPYLSSTSKMSPIFARADPIQNIAYMAKTRNVDLSSRQTSTDVCKRWAQMSAVVNGTLYIYGGQATTSPSQTDNAWNNNFLTLDLTKNWQIGSPSLTTAARPSQMPALSLGTLWNDMNNLYLYGGQFSWKPVVSPTPNSLWQYSIKSKSWTQHSNPKDVNGQTVERAAEGAGVSVPNLGRGFYLGGHLDGYTTVGWSQSVPRVYLESTLEFTMPGAANSALKQSPAGSDGAYRNLTTDSAGFPQRADGVLVYVPGYSTSGIIVALGGGTSDKFTQMNVIDVYDIAASTWYRQAVSGPTPKTRVNPCAVAASAADGSSTQIYMYGGQNLQPALNQTQYNDMWILTVPSFTWIQVDQTTGSIPPARAGHTCTVWNSQMIVIGGYVGEDLSCDSPGIYVFNTSSLTWQTQYNAPISDDPLNRQAAQKNDPNALQGSYGYEVPTLVQQVIGGNATGFATATAPAQFATGGPLVSGRPVTYTPTGTSLPGATSSGSSGSNNANNQSNSSNAGAIAAGVIAGILAILAGYLGFCAWVYRRQLKLYKNHLAVMQRESLNDPSRHLAGLGAFATTSRNYSDKDRDSDIAVLSVDENANSLAMNTSNSGSRDGPHGRRNDLNSNNPYRNVPGGAGYATAESSTEDLMRGQEPSFLGVMLNPRRSLRVVNKD